MVFFTSLSYSSPINVQVVFPFSPSSSQASMVRELIDSANKNQSKYNFIFSSRPGAGGSIAANATVNKPELTLLATSNSFYIRPLLYKDSHEVDDFNMVSVICKAQPLGLFSKKYSNIRDLEKQSVTVGLVHGSITALFVRILQRENPQIRVVEVPYKGTPEGVVDMMGGHLDVAIEFSGRNSTGKFINDKTVKNIGITGFDNRDDFRSFNSQGVKGLENVTVDFIMMVDKKTDTATLKELNSIFNQAIDSKVEKRCTDDHGFISKISLDQAKEMHQTSKSIWSKFTQGMEKQ